MTKTFIFDERENRIYNEYGGMGAQQLTLFEINNGEEDFCI